MIKTKKAKLSTNFELNFILKFDWITLLLKQIGHFPGDDIKNLLVISSISSISLFLSNTGHQIKLSVGRELITSF